MARTIVKVCGLTRLEDARAALEAGADWLGFILMGESPRRVSPEQARSILDALPGAVGVAVMVSPSPDEARELAIRAGVRRVQLHGVDAASWPRDFPLPVTFVVPVAEDGAMLAPLPDKRDLVMLDTARGQTSGGSGRTFPWFVAATVAAEFQVIVAGGLEGSNVEKMLDQVRPFGVDASSRLEASPGIKDPDKVRRFIAAVRRHDTNRAT